MITWLQQRPKSHGLGSRGYSDKHQLSLRDRQRGSDSLKEETDTPCSISEKETRSTKASLQSWELVNALEAEIKQAKARVSPLYIPTEYKGWWWDILLNSL